jgi:hypothetical protein
LQKYIMQSKSPFPVYTIAAGDQRLLKLAATPATFVISVDGRVQKDWAGAYREDTATELEKFFDVRLPGLAANPRRLE